MAGPGFLNRGGAKDYVPTAHILSAKYLTAGEALGFQMISHAIWALLWSILIQNWIKKHSWSKFWGGEHPLHPRLDPPLLIKHRCKIVKYMYRNSHLLWGWGGGGEVYSLMEIYMFENFHVYASVRGVRWHWITTACCEEIMWALISWLLFSYAVRS